MRSKDGEDRMPYIDMKLTGENIRNIMRTRGVSVRSLQGVFGFATPQAIYKWLRGVSLPCVDNLVVLADILGCSIDDILIVKNTKG